MRDAKPVREEWGPAKRTGEHKALKTKDLDIAMPPSSGQRVGVVSANVVWGCAGDVKMAGGIGENPLDRVFFGMVVMKGGCCGRVGMDLWGGWDMLRQEGEKRGL